MKLTKEQITRQAEEFHERNPNVYRLFEQFTLQVIKKGYRHYSADAIMHRVRWETQFGDNPARHDFKINNNHVAYYSRMFMARNPWHDGFFRIRKVR